MLPEYDHVCYLGRHRLTDGSGYGDCLIAEAEPRLQVAGLARRRPWSVAVG